MHWHDADGAETARGEAPPGWAIAATALSWLRAQLVAERERWPLWFPVALGGGIGTYFSLSLEPAPWIAPVGLAGALFFTGVLWRRGGAGVVAAGVLAFALGFAAAQLQEWRAAAPVLERHLGGATIEGRLLVVDPLPEGVRLVIAPTHIDRLAAARLPARVRVRLRRGDDAMVPGAFIRVKAELYPPPAPAMPGAFDFERRAFFDRIGAVGYAFGRAERLTPPPDAAWGWGWNAVEAVRALMTQRIRAVLPDTSGAIAAALITGDTHAIPPDKAGAFRDAGLAHILVIAGLHMGMVAGIVFFALRALLALIPRVALNYPTKKWAAGAALAVTFGYMLLSGATVSSRRAFVMIGLAFFGVLIDRLSVSARAVAYAAIVIMLMTPESTTGPSFQMSFAAVGALIAFYEALRPRLSRWHSHAGPLRRLALYILGIALTTVVTTMATMPFTIYHFNRFPLYSVVANALAVPITGFWIMPWGILACLLMPLHLEALALTPMSVGIDLVTAIALRVTAWPGAILQVPSMPVAGLLLLSVGGLWLCIWQRRWRWLGLAPLAACGVAMALDRPPDLLISVDSHLMAVRGAAGDYLLSSARVERDAAATWMRRAAAAVGPIWPAAGESADGTLSCDAEACLYRARGRLVALERDNAALAEDCAQADLVVSANAAHRLCRGPVVIDRIDTWRSGGQAVWLDRAGIRVETVRDWQGERPWVPRPEQLRSAERLSSAASARRDAPAP